jgi:hypothetical protein
MQPQCGWRDIQIWCCVATTIVVVDRFLKPWVGMLSWAFGSGQGFGVRFFCSRLWFVLWKWTTHVEWRSQCHESEVIISNKQVDLIKFLHSPVKCRIHEDQHVVCVDLIIMDLSFPKDRLLMFTFTIEFSFELWRRFLWSKLQKSQVFMFKFDVFFVRVCLFVTSESL